VSTRPPRRARACALLPYVALAFAAGAARAGDGGRVTVRVRAGGGPVDGAAVHAGAVRATTGDDGTARLVLPAGPAAIAVVRLGFAADTVRLDVRAGLDTTVDVALAGAALELAPVVVTTTRVARRLEDEPERVEVLAGEDVGEKPLMHPGDLRVLTSEMGGVRVQPLASGTGAAAIRLQGLRGQYTEILVDGLPLLGADAPELGVAQVPPLDLAQAEVIQGAATALYGPAAAGGVLNLVPRRPADGQPETVAQLNGGSRAAADVSLWLARQPTPRFGWTLLAGGHHQRRTDVDGDGWADLPGYTRGELRPRVFWNGAGGRSLVATTGASAEDRDAGATHAFAAGYPAAERTTTRRGDFGVTARLPFGGAGVLTLRGSATREARHDAADSGPAGAVAYDERRNTEFAEATWLGAAGRATWLAGTAFRRDARTVVFEGGFEASGAGPPDHDFDHRVPAVFAQLTAPAARWLSVSASGRLDAHSRYGTYASPRLSVLAHAGRAYEARLSLASGVTAPTSSTEDAAAYPLVRTRLDAGVRVERLRTGSLDLTARRGALEVDATLFASEVRRALLPRLDASGGITLVNATDPVRTRGAHAYAVWAREPVAITAFWQGLVATEREPGEPARRDVPLTPAHTLGLDVAWEEDDTGTRFGLEVFHVGRQPLEFDPGRTHSVPYALVGLLASRQFGRALVYVNAENVGDVRLTRWSPAYLPAPGPAGRTTTDPWAPAEGRVINGGVRLSF